MVMEGGGKTVEVGLPAWLGGAAVELDGQVVDMALLGLITFVLFYLLDPFRIIEKVDERLVRLYRPPERSAVKDLEVLCVVNPISGNKNGKWQYAKVAFPMLRSAGAIVDMVQLEHGAHAAEIGEEMGKKSAAGDKKAFPAGGVLIMGGDGTFFEFVNGVIRGLSKSSMDIDASGVREALQNLRVSHIPVGSSNGIARNTECLTAYEALVQVIAGDGNGNNTSYFDLTAVDAEFADPATNKTTSSRRIYDVVCTSIGFVCDYNELAEYRWRRLGKTLKEILASAFLIAKRKVHHGRLLVRPCELSKEERLELATQHGYRDTAELPEARGHPGWLEISGPFVGVTWTTLGWLAHNSCFAPGTGFGDGQASLIVMKNSSRWQMIRAAMAFDKGDAGKLSSIYLYRVSEMKFLPQAPAPLDTTGIIVPNVKSVHAKVLPRVMQYLRDPTLQ